jgi:hypothetical protein
MSCSVAVEGSGKVLGALGPWQLSAKPVVAYKLPVIASINKGIIPRIGASETQIERTTCTHECYRPRLRKIERLGVLKCSL